MKPKGGWTNQFLDEMRRIGDPLADKTVKLIFERGRVEEVNRLLAELHRTDEVPAGFSQETRYYLEKTAGLPEWAESDKIKRGEQLFLKHGLLAGLIMWYASLPECYTLEYESEILNLSGQLEAHTLRRVLETARMIFPVMLEGGLGPSGSGVRQIQKVRLIHAAIRHLILLRVAKPTAIQATTFGEVLEYTSWDVESEGQPINQEQIGFTLLSFGYLFIRSLKHFGINPTREEKDAYLHCWNVAGHIIGLKRDMMAETMDEAEELFTTIKRRWAKQTDAGQALAKALLGAMEDQIPLSVAKPVAGMLARRLLGRETADLLGITGRYSLLTRVLYGTLLEAIRGIEWLTAIMRGGPWITRCISRVLARQVMKFLLERTFKGSPPLHLPDHLRKAWGIDRR